MWVVELQVVLLLSGIFPTGSGTLACGSVQ